MKRSILLSLLIFIGTLSAVAQDPGTATPPVQPAAPAAPAATAAPSGGDPAPAAPAATPARKSWEDDLDDKIPDDSKGGDSPPTPPAKPDDKKPAAPAKPAEPPKQEDEIPNFKGQKELRDWANQRHKTAKELESKVKTYEDQIKELNNRTPKTDGQIGRAHV